jgi:PAS domain S-box-containing protein
MNHTISRLEPDTILQIRLLRWSKYSSFFVLLITILVLAGWQWNITFLKRPVPHLTAMNPLTALTFLFSVCSFLLLFSADHSRKLILSGNILACIVLLTGIIRISGTIPGFHFSVDHILFAGSLESDSPGNLPDQMTVNTASCFILSGTTLLLLNTETSRKQMPAQYIALTTIMVAIFSIVGYLYRVQAFYGLFTYIPMALHTAVCFLLISMAILFANPDKGFMKEFTSMNTGSLMASSSIPLAILFPIVLGYLGLYGYWNGLFTTEFGASILVLSIIGVFITIIWYNTQLLNRRDVLRKSTYQALLESEERFRMLVSSVKDYAIFMLTPDGLVLSWNEGAERIKGYKAEEIIGRHISCFYTDEEAKRGEPAHNLSRAREEGRFEQEGWRVRKDGSQFWADIIFTAIHDTNGQVVGFSKVTRDITESKKITEQIGRFNTDLEEQIRKKTGELTSIFERINEAFIALDSNFCFTYISKKAAALIRQDPAPLIGKCVWEVFPDAVGTTTYDALTRAMAEQVPVVNTDYYAPLDLWQENHIYPSPDGLSIFIRNITEQKKTEKKITDYKYALDQSSIVAITDQKGIIKHVNDNFCKISKYSAAELLGQDHRIINSGYHPISFIRDLWVTIANGRIWKGELCNKAKDGTIYWVDTTIVPFLNDGGKPIEYLAIRADITERKKREIELLTAHERLLFHIENAPLGYMEWDNQSMIKTWSRRSEEIFGWSEEELLKKQKNGFSLVCEEDLPETNRITRELLDGVVDRNNVVCRSYTKYGRVIWCEWFNSILKDTDGKVITVMSLVRDITERKIAEERLQQSYFNIRQLASHLQNVREEERAGIAREIHDELGQQLTGLKMDLSWIAKRVPAQVDSQVSEKIKTTIELLDITIKTVRRIATQLRPSILDDLGLIAAIEWQSQEFQKRSGISTQFNTSILKFNASAAVAIGLFRICQESLTNVARHAEARHVCITLQEQEKQHILLKIEDDGLGFEYNKIGSKKTLGLLGMKERTLMMGGKFEMVSMPGKGTTLFVKVPLTANLS